MLKERLNDFFKTGDNNLCDIAKIYSISNRTKWEEIDKKIKELFIEEADKLKGCEFEPISLRYYTKFAKDGDRSEHASIYFPKRKKLQILVIAECIKNTGEYLETIADGIWSICEESTWVIPAHIYQVPGGGELEYPDMERPYIDLMAANTSATLAFIYKILEDSLKEDYNHILKRIRYELDNRILNPYLEHNDFWWMCYKESNAHIINNWNPMCTSHVVETFLLIENDKNRIAEALDKAAKSLDIFLATYDIDGGCDEGTSYWRIAGGSLFDALEAIYLASDGKINIFKEKLIYNIGDYICKMVIGKNHYVNFADGSAILKQPFELLYNFGKRINNRNMIKLAALSKEGSANQMIHEKTASMARLLRGIFSYSELDNSETELLLKSDFLKGVGVMAAREKDSLDKGWFIATKAGHNDESHNHNDVGSFVIYLDGSPMIIDLGVGTYTKKTFSDRRYEIYTMQSSYHNTPIINGYEQMPGKEYKANKIKATIEKNYEMMSCEIQDAYPKEANIVKWVRTTIRKDEVIRIIDSFELSEANEKVKLVFMTPNKPEITNDGVIINGFYNQKALMKFDNQNLDVVIEKIDIPKDELLTPVWNECVFRIILSSKELLKKGEIEVIFNK